MTTQYGSTVVQCWHALYDLLRDEAFSWPAGLDVATAVEFGWPGDNPTAEMVLIVPGLIEPAQQTYETFGPGNKHESFGIVVSITSALEYPKAFEAVDRVAEIQGAIEQRIRNNFPTAGNRHPRPDVYGVQWWAAATANTFAWPQGDRGWWARSELVIVVRAHI